MYVNDTWIKMKVHTRVTRHTYDHIIWPLVMAVVSSHPILTLSVVSSVRPQLTTTQVLEGWIKITDGLIQVTWFSFFLFFIFFFHIVLPVRGNGVNNKERKRETQRTVQLEYWVTRKDRKRKWILRLLDDREKGNSNGLHLIVHWYIHHE